MASQDHGIHSFEECMLEGSDYSSYMTLLCDIIDAEPSIYEEVAKKKGKETMIKEYQLIKRHDV